MLFESLQITRVDLNLDPIQTFSILSLETFFESIGILIDIQETIIPNKIPSLQQAVTVVNQRFFSSGVEI